MWVKPPRKRSRPTKDKPAAARRGKSSGSWPPELRRVDAGGSRYACSNCASLFRDLAEFHAHAHARRPCRSRRLRLRFDDGLKMRWGCSRCCDEMSTDESFREHLDEEECAPASYYGMEGMSVISSEKVAAAVDDLVTANFPSLKLPHPRACCFRYSFVPLVQLGDYREGTVGAAIERGELPHLGIIFGGPREWFDWELRHTRSGRST